MSEARFESVFCHASHADVRLPPKPEARGGKKVIRQMTAGQAVSRLTEAWWS